MRNLYLPFKQLAGLALFGFCLLASTDFLHAQPGALDSTFHNTGKYILQQFPSTELNEVFVQPDGKIVTCGYGDGPSGNLDVLVYRFNPDGTLDDDFGTDGYVIRDVDGGADNPVDVTLLPDGKILVLITSFYRTLFMRLNPDGSYDETFGNEGLVLTTNLLANESVAKMLVQPDGKMLTFGYYKPASKKRALVRRYLPDGSEDLGFGTNGIANPGFSNTVDLELQDATLQPDGKILLTGLYGAGTTAAMVVARLKSNGVPDSSFSQDGKILKVIGPDDYTSSVLLQTDGKIIIAGNAFYGGIPSITMLRYKPDGSTDNSFGTFGVAQTLIGDLSCVWSLLLQPDDKILASGYSHDPATNRYVYTMTRWNSNGFLDPSFGDQGKVVFYNVIPTYKIETLVETYLQPDGKIIAVGYALPGGSSTAPGKSIVFRFQSGLTVGVSDVAEGITQTSVYPNPLSGEWLHLEYEMTNPGNISVSLYDLKGTSLKTFFTNESRMAGPQHEFLALPANLPAGMYFLRMDTETGSVITRIAKE